MLSPTVYVSFNNFHCHPIHPFASLSMLSLSSLLVNVLTSYPTAKILLKRDPIHHILTKFPHLVLFNKHSAPSTIGHFGRGSARRFSGYLFIRGSPFRAAMDAFQVGCSQNGGHGTCSTKAKSLLNFGWFNHGSTIPIISTQNQLAHDIKASALTALVALACLRFWDEMAKQDVFD